MTPYVWVGLQVTGHPEEQKSSSGQVECAHRRRNVTLDSTEPCILARNSESPGRRLCLGIHKVFRS